MRTWYERWERLMTTYQPARAEGVEAVLDLVEASVGAGQPRLLDLGGGTGSVCSQALARWPQAEATLFDLDPVLLTIAGAVLPPEIDVVQGDLDNAQWVRRLPHPGYDAVIAVMTLHYFPPDRLARLYAEIAGILTPDGVLVILDEMPDPGLPGFSTRLTDWTGRNRPDGPRWEDWWTEATQDPALHQAAEQRASLLNGRASAEWAPPVDWHLQALRDQGYTETGVGWRRGLSAAVVATGHRRSHADRGVARGPAW